MSALTWRRSGVIVALVLLIVGLVAGGVAAATIYVDASASGTDDGLSWTNAYTDLQTGLTNASNGDEIWVAEGTYKPSSPAGRGATFQLENGVALYGGFDGSEGARSERNWSLHEAILSGDIGTEDVSTDNAYHVVKSNQNDGSAVLDGFTITGGNANGSYPDNRGGGMYNHNSSPTVTNCTFSGNTTTGYGGGMYNSSSSPTVTNCTFSGNTATGYGGGMYNFYSSPTVTNCTFSNNTANDGGGMYNYLDSPTVTNCTFSNNTATNDGGGMCNHPSSPTVTNCTFSNNSAGSGGGMYNYIGSPTVTNCTFSNNTATNDGGGMCNDNYSHTQVTDCTFSGNTANDGGGMYNDNYSNTQVTDCTFSGNTANDGGGMYNSSCYPTVINCTFSNNTVTNDGGGMYNSQSSPTVTNCTFSNNTATNRGGGMFNFNFSSSKVRNTILWGDTASSGTEIENKFGTPTVEYCVVEGGYTGGTDIITADPLLETLGDYGGSTETIPLLPGSSAIDSANSTYAPTTDQRGVTRPQGPADDIGAYEYEPPPPPGDVNNDGTIDVLDVRLCLQIALGVIPGTAGERQRADMNGDGQVTLTDAQLLADYIIGISH